MDFAAAYTIVNHSWIFRVLEMAELRVLICRLLRSGSHTHVEFAKRTRGQLFMVKGVRPGCSESGFPCVRAFGR